MSDDETPQTEPETDELTRFQKLARALFRVDKRDVPKHVPTKRPARNERQREK